MEAILQQYSCYEREKLYPKNQLPFLKFNPTVQTKQFEETGHVGLGYMSTHSHAIQPLSTFAEDLKFPILSSFVKSENLLLCLNSTTFEVLAFNIQNNKDFTLSYSFNLKESILSKYSTGIISNGKTEDLIFKSNESYTTIIWQIEYSEMDNSLFALLLDYGTPSYTSYKPATIVKLDLKGQVDWIVKDEFCENGFLIKENSNVICGMNTSGVITECFHTDGSEINPKVSFRAVKAPSDRYHNFQMINYRNRYLFPEWSGVNYSTDTNDCAVLEMVDESGIPLNSASHSIYHPFSVQEKGGYVHSFALDKSRGLVFSLVNPGPLSSICISHLGSGGQLLTIGPFSNSYCKLHVDEKDQILYIVSVVNGRNSLEIHTFEYGRFNDLESRRKIAELWKSEKYLTTQHQTYLKTNAENLARKLENALKSRLESIENSRRISNIRKIREEIFEYGRLVTISQADLKTQDEFETLNAAPKEKHEKMIRIMEELRKNKDIIY